jgi:hypothetical protein
MPLVMSLKTGDDFYVEDERVIVGAIHGRMHFEVQVEKTGSVFQVTDDEAQELFTDVFVSAGPRPASGIARVAIEAPREITILRGDRYRGF